MPRGLSHPPNVGGSDQAWLADTFGRRCLRFEAYHLRLGV